MSNRRAFTLVELLVVIALIGVLAGILLVAVGSATNSAQRSRTMATMNSVSAAIDGFVLEHGQLPGLIPAHLLGEGDVLSQSQNVVLHLTGGARTYATYVNGAGEEVALDPAALAEYERFRDLPGTAPVELTPISDGDLTYYVIYKSERFGEGPWIKGRPYPPYLAPKDDEVRFPDVSPGTYDPLTSGHNDLPDVVDAWGQPLLIFTRQRGNGPLITEHDHGDDDDTHTAQFHQEGMCVYAAAATLGDKEARQRQEDMSTGGKIGSRLAGADEGGAADGEREHWLYLMLAHPTFTTLNASTFEGQPAGAYLLLSAGEDGIYLSHQDGPLLSNGQHNPSFASMDFEDLEDFDDIRMAGGAVR